MLRPAATAAARAQSSEAPGVRGLNMKKGRQFHVGFGASGRLGLDVATGRGCGRASLVERSPGAPSGADAPARRLRAEQKAK
jgi:hypothetical protein